MDYSQVEEQFQSLKQQFTAGKVDEAAFKAKLNELMVQDAQGHWWMIGYETGQWYTHDGTAWVRADPPGRGSPAPAQPKKTSPSAPPVTLVEEATPSGKQPVAQAPPAAGKSASETLPPVTSVKKMGWPFWLGWIGALGAGVLGLVWLDSSSGYLSRTLQGLIFGLVVGFIQWLIMRLYVRGSWWWILVNAIYMLVVGGVGESSYYSNVSSPLLVLYLIGNLVTGPVLVARRRRANGGG